GDSKWISGAESRALVHRWRAESDAVAVGISTALTDDPLLTARDLDPPPARQPSRVVFDSSARLPLDSKLIASIDEAPLFIVVGADAPADRLVAFRAAGAEVLTAGGLRSALATLGERGITSLFLEGGPTLAGSFLDAGEIDELRLFIAPVLIGGEEAPGLAGGLGVERIADARRAPSVESELIGEDILLKARLCEW
ncbi:MAG: RibD family protein, partial [Solirubrobacterales bacterium]